MVRFLTTALVLALSSQLVSAQASCSANNKCPEASPCCSQYGQCGTGAYCLGGCDPLSSFSLDACAPQPVCQDRTTTFENMDRLVSNTKYLGDSSKADFVYSGEPLIYNNQVLLTMPANSVGTLLASTVYMWYGKTTAKLTTSGGQGVVTAFILLGDTKDEIDFEFVGYDLNQAQTNYYFQGFLNYANGGNSSVSGGNTLETPHTYEIDWKEDSITWSIDGKSVRTLQKSSTWNSTSNRYDYPQTPARIQLSLWPAGAASNPEGTKQWAGGEINWSSPYMSNGYYYAAFESVQIECYDPPSGVNQTGSKAVSYMITDSAGLNTSVSITDKNTILSSFDATGLNMAIGGTSASSAPGSAQSGSGAQVPGQGSSGSGANGNRGSDSSSSSSGSGSGSGSSTGSSTGSASTGFVQGGGSSSSSSSASSLLAGGVTNRDILMSAAGVGAVMLGAMFL